MAIHYEVRGKIAEIVIDRQEVRNALDAESIQEMTSILSDIRDNENVWVAIITGAGDKAFSAGADLAKVAGQALEFKDSIARSMTAIDNARKPLIAAINGLAVGGGLEIAIACDIRICSENATFGLGEPRWGLMPGGGGTQRLPRRIPLGIALEMLFTGKRIDAQEAYRVGLVNKVVSLSELMPTARQLAQDICRCAPLAVRAIKQAALSGLEMPLREGLLLESMFVESLGKTEDIKEGVTAFLQKREPRWQSK